MKRLAKLLTTAMLTGIGLFAGLASAQTLCVWDPLGTAGDYYTLFKDYQIEAKRWNVNLNLEVYPDDNDLIAKFENGHCDMASILGLRARKFNKFTGTIDAAPGSLDNYVQMRNLLNVLVGPKASKYMTEGVTEVVGILPMGAGYAVTADRSVVSLQTAAGKRVLVPSFADNFAELIKQINVVEVRTEIVDYGRAFKQGKGDIIIMPLALYKPFEIDKVLAEKNGGILRRPEQPRLLSPADRSLPVAGAQYGQPGRRPPVDLHEALRLRLLGRSDSPDRNRNDAPGTARQAHAQPHATRALRNQLRRAGMPRHQCAEAGAGAAGGQQIMF